MHNVDFLSACDLPALLYFLKWSLKLTLPHCAGGLAAEAHIIVALFLRAVWHVTLSLWMWRILSGFGLMVRCHAACLRLIIGSGDNYLELVTWLGVCQPSRSPVRITVCHPHRRMYQHLSSTPSMGVFWCSCISVAKDYWSHKMKELPIRRGAAFSCTCCLSGLSVSQFHCKTNMIIFLAFVVATTLHWPRLPASLQPFTLTSAISLNYRYWLEKKASCATSIYCVIWNRGPKIWSSAFQLYSLLYTSYLCCGEQLSTCGCSL